MATVLLTDKAAKAAKAKASRREIWDSKVPGLCLRVSKNGKKVWLVRYRSLDGRQPRLALGDYTDRQGVKWARAEAEDVRTAVRRGADPAAERKAKKAAARSQTIRNFGDLADAYLAACRAGNWMPKGKRQSARSIRDAEGILKRHIRPVIGELRLADVTRANVRQLLRDMRDSGIGAQTNRTQAIVRQVFAFAIAEFEGTLISVNPAVGAAVVQEEGRRRVLTDSELKTLWGGLQDPAVLRVKSDDPDGVDRAVNVSRALAVALQLAMLLLQRRGEIAGMMESETNASERTWTITGGRMKNRRPHLVPLPARSLKLIEEARRLAQPARAAKVKELKALDREQPSDWPLFPSSRDATLPIHSDSLTHALSRIFKALGIQGASTHDLRRTGSTALTSERIASSGFVRSLVLSHTTSSDGGAGVSREHYDANSYVGAKRGALEAWEGLLLEIVGECERPSNVSDFPAVGSAA